MWELFLSARFQGPSFPFALATQDILRSIHFPQPTVYYESLCSRLNTARLSLRRPNNGDLGVRKSLILRH